MSERALHLQVAEALGWTECGLGWVFSQQLLCGTDPTKIGGFDGFGRKEIPRFDSDWCATGPLIERLPVTLGRYRLEAPFPIFVDNTGDVWWAIHPGLTAEPTARMERTGQTALMAVCNLILALHDAGKLKELLG